MKTNEVKNDEQSEPETIGGISTDILGKFLEFLTLRSVREEREKFEKKSQ